MGDALMRSFTNAVWRILTADPAVMADIQQRGQLSEVVARCVANRLTLDPLFQWGPPDLAHLHDPYKMLGMDRAVERIRAAAQRRPRP